MKTTLRVEGGQQLARALDQLSARISKQVMRQALTSEAAEPIRDRASSIVARAPGEPDIADHIVVSTGRAKDKQAAVLVGPSTGRRSDQPKRSFAQQGSRLEWGTSRMQMRPFMRPAFDAVASGAIVRIGSALWRALAAKGVSSRGGGGGGGTL